MRSKKVIYILILIITCSFFCVDSFPQDKNRIGLTVAADIASLSKVRALFGISLERLINKRNSVETGIYYRTAVNDNLVVEVPYGSNFSVTEQFFILEKFLSIPLLYNYKSKLINLSVGPAIDIYTGWKEKKHMTNPPLVTVNPLQSYKFDNKLLWGAIAKISKPIKVNSEWMMEPGIYFNPVFTSYSLFSKSFSETRQYFGVSLTAKYIL